MKIRMLMDNRVFFAKGSEVEVTEGEAKRLLSLGFAEKVADKKAVVKEEKVVEEKKPSKKK